MFDDCDVDADALLANFVLVNLGVALNGVVFETATALEEIPGGVVEVTVVRLTGFGDVGNAETALAAPAAATGVDAGKLGILRRAGTTALFTTAAAEGTDAACVVFGALSAGS